MKRKNGLRLPLIVAAALLFCGLLIFSAFRVRFPTESGEKNEFNVIEYSLTDSIKRGQDGVFTVTSLEKPTGKGGPAKTQPEPCPT
jgi:hypothetical protein